MAPRPSMGVPGPRAMPPYKYATGVRNPNPQVVQPIALQQVWAEDHHTGHTHLVFLSHQAPKPIVFNLLSYVLYLSLPGSAGCARSGPGASHSLHAGCCTPSGAETDAR